MNIKEIKNEYLHVINILNREKRVINGECKVETYLDRKPPLSINEDISSVVEYFQKNPDVEIITVTNSNNEPIGILEENKIKEFIYSPFGRSLMRNSSIKKSKLKSLIQPCGITDINCDMSTNIELFSNNPESIGIIITDNSKYYGFLSARAIITIMNEQNLLHAREQNPLTKLPGNSMIEKYISEVSKNKNFYILCYYDLNHFKAFNDVYGFRNGDRAIQLFADIIRKNLSQEFFKAHIGGDDFFVAIEFKEEYEKEYLNDITKILQKFADDVRELYLKDDKDKGYIISMDRDKKEKKFPLLDASAATLIVRDTSSNRSIESINDILSIQKKVAKNDKSNLSASTLL